MSRAIGHGPKFQTGNQAGQKMNASQTDVACSRLRRCGPRVYLARGAIQLNWGAYRPNGRLNMTVHQEMGSARVSRAADGVAPSTSCSCLRLAVWSDKLVRRNLRRDAANHTPEAYAP